MTRTLSVGALLLMMAGMLGLFFSKALFSPSPVVIAAQCAAVGLMAWARLTLGRRSFHAAADPTAGGLVTGGPYRFIRHPIYTAACLFGWAGMLGNWSAGSPAAPDSVPDHFRDRAPEVKGTYAEILKAARKLGLVREEAKKTSIHLVRKTAFAGVATRKTALILTLKSGSDLPSSRVTKREHVSVEYWQKVRGRNSRLLELVPAGDLEWSYAAGKYTFGDIFRHLPGIERYMYAENVRHRRSAYPGHAIELARGHEGIRAYGVTEEEVAALSRPEREG